MLLIFSTSNTQERLVTPLVDRLEREITPQARDLLLASYSERKGNVKIVGELKILENFIHSYSYSYLFLS